MAVITHLKRMDWILIGAALLMAALGLVSIYSSSSGNDFLNFEKQIAFLSAGFFLMIILSFLDWRTLREDPYLILFFYLLCVVALTGLFFFASEIRGVKSWYKLGSLSVDPIEYIRIVLIVLLAKYFSMRHIEMYRIRHILLSGFYVLLPAILIFFQPNLGAVLILIALWVGTLLISGIKTRHFLLLCLLFLLIFILSWSTLLKEYQKERILTFIQPQVEPLGKGWSQAQAKIAIGSGGLTGQGIGRGSQTQYGFLSEPQTDFVFGALAEETGLVGVGILLILFSILVWRIIKIAITSQTNFPRLFAAGLAINLISQAFIHIGMNLGILPIIGIPLPLVSYGGSSLIANFIGFGILQSIKTRS